MIEYTAFRGNARNGKQNDYIALLVAVIETLIIFLVFIGIMYILVADFSATAK